MSRQRGLLSEVFKSFVNSLKPKQRTGTLIGNDYLGNTYYEIKPSVGSSKARPSRYFTPKDGDESKFDQPLPAEWEAWLRLRRQDPPSEEEITRNLQMMAMKKSNAAALESQYSKPPEEENQVVTGIKDFPSYKDYEIHPGKRTSN